MIKCCQEIKKSIYFFHFQAVCIGICAYMHTTFLVGEIADRFQFSKRLDFENAQNVRGVEKLRHRAGLLCRVKVVKLYYNGSKSPFPSKVDKKNLLPRFFVNNKMIPPLNPPPPFPTPGRNKRTVPNLCKSATSKQTLKD